MPFLCSGTNEDADNSFLREAIRRNWQTGLEMSRQTFMPLEKLHIFQNQVLLAETAKVWSRETGNKQWNRAGPEYWR